MAGQTTRLCGFCLTQVPLAELDGGQCADLAACKARADAKYLYPLTEARGIEAALAARSAAQGRPPARQAAAPQPAAQPEWRWDAVTEQQIRDFPELAPAPKTAAAPATDSTQRRAARRRVSA